VDALRGIIQDRVELLLDRLDGVEMLGVQAIQFGLAQVATGRGLHVLVEQLTRDEVPVAQVDDDALGPPLTSPSTEATWGRLSSRSARSSAAGGCWRGDHSRQANRAANASSPRSRAKAARRTRTSPRGEGLGR
jgi:hypothetical protein